MKRTTLDLIKYGAPSSAAAAWNATTGEPSSAELVELPAVPVRCLLTGPQPATGDDLDNLPEGERDGSTFKFYTRSELPDRGDESTGRPADVIVWRGSRWKVVDVAPYTAPLGARRVMMRRED